MKETFSLLVYSSEVAAVAEDADDNLSHVNIPLSAKEQFARGFCGEAFDDFMGTYTADSTVGVVQWLRENNIPYTVDDSDVPSGWWAFRAISGKTVIAVKGGYDCEADAERAAEEYFMDNGGAPHYETFFQKLS